MAVGTWRQPDRTTQGGTEYKVNLENCFMVAERLARAFAPHEQDTPNMTVRVDPGWIWANGTLIEKSAQITGTITKPTSKPRIDRVVISAANGNASVVTGTEADNPVPPAIPAGYLPCAQIYLTPTMSAITNSVITDERVLMGGGGGEGTQQIGIWLYSSGGSYTWTRPAWVSRVLVILCGGGGGGGGSGLSAGGGGGAGGWAWGIYSVTGVSQVTVTVGSGGICPDPHYGGTNGGTSSFGSYISATGGGGGASGHAGGGGGVGGSGSNGLVNGVGASGGNASGDYSGAGGSLNIWPYGGRGGARVNGGNGQAGVNYGSGGSGGFYASYARPGGNGAPGMVMIVGWKE